MSGIALPVDPEMERALSMPVSQQPIVDRVAAEMTHAWDISPECAENVISEFLYQTSQTIRRGQRVELEYLGSFELHLKRSTTLLLYVSAPSLKEPLPPRTINCLIPENQA